MIGIGRRVTNEFTKDLTELLEKNFAFYHTPAPKGEDPRVITLESRESVTCKVCNTKVVTSSLEHHCESHQHCMLKNTSTERLLKSLSGTSGYFTLRYNA